MESLTSPKITVGRALPQAPHQEHVHPCCGGSRRSDVLRYLRARPRTGAWRPRPASAPTASPSARTSAAAGAAAAGCEGTGEACHEEDCPFGRPVERDWRRLSARPRVDHGHLRRSADGGGLRRRLHHERRGGDDRTRGAARVEGRSRQLNGVAARRPRGRRRGRRRHQPRHPRDRRRATPARAALFVDARATPAQRKALVAMVKRWLGRPDRQRRRRRRPRRSSSSTTATTSASRPTR